MLVDIQIWICVGVVVMVLFNLTKIAIKFKTKSVL